MRNIIKDGLAGAVGPARGLREAQVGLPDGDVRAIVAAAWEVDAEAGFDGGLARLVMVLAATGARFSQAIRMRVGDVQAARLMIPLGRKGRIAKATTHVAVPVAPDVLAALAPAVNGRKGHEPLFMRPSWRLVAGAWERSAELGPWRSVNDLRRPWKAIVERAGLAPSLAPYCLRHSSIARSLRLGARGVDRAIARHVDGDDRSKLQRADRLPARRACPARGHLAFAGDGHAARGGAVGPIKHRTWRYLIFEGSGK